MAENIQQEIEDKVIDCINSEVAGRLIIFKPEKNDLGADLAVEKRGEYKGKEIYFKINSLVGPSKADTFVEDFLQESFRVDKNFYLLFVYFDEVTQKIKDYIWLIPSLQFRDIAEIIKSAGGQNLLRFEAPLDVKVKNKYSKFLVETKGLGKLVLDALEKGGKFNLKEIDLSEKSNINLENLKDFLIEARRNTYASNNSPVDNPRLLESIQLEFQKGDYSYRDVYFLGNKRFMGQEIVYQESKPVWGMNYIGGTIGKLETIFLKESLFKLSEKCRFGEVCEYTRRELKYQDQGVGDLESFSGQEKIYSGTKSIYKLDYQGGLISDKL
jgi:hypothetical protein